MKYTCSNWRNEYTKTLRKRLGKPAFRDWDIREDIFKGDRNADFGSDEYCTAGDIYCFTMTHYVNFLDEVKSREELIEGLFQLSPFAEDAFEVACSMTEMDFVEFKLALVQERLASKTDGMSTLPDRYCTLLLPNRFPQAILLANMAVVSLGVALIRIMEVELGIE